MTAPHNQSQPKGDLVRRLRAFHSKIMSEAADRIEYLEATEANEIASLRSQVSELRAALEPFAEIADELFVGLSDDQKNNMHWAVPTVRQFRAARKALALNSQHSDGEAK